MAGRPIGNSVRLRLLALLLSAAPLLGAQRAMQTTGVKEQATATAAAPAHVLRRVGPGEAAPAIYRRPPQQPDGHERTLLVGTCVLALSLVAVTLLLLRSRRRLQAANALLQRSLEQSSTLQREQAALRQNLQQLERLDSLGLLAGGFAHDFNNLLVAVRGNAQLLLENPDLDGRPEMLGDIVSASQRAADLCKEILSYAHASPTPKAPLDLREVLTALAPLARAGLGAGVALELDLGAAPATVSANRAQLEQMFLNILVNAGNAIRDQGRIQLSVDDVRLDGPPATGNWFGELPDEPLDCVAVTVLDNGVGMSPETVQRIFDPFFTTRLSGRGLGLAAVFGILRRHGGVIEVVSEAERGTQFTVYLPRLHEDASEPVVELPASPPAAPDRRGKVLVVDDERAVLEVARGALEAMGHDVLVAEDYSAALDLAERHAADLAVALVDVTMPAVDGPSLARLLLRKCSRLRVIMMTGHAEAQVRLDGLDAPVLGKPFDLSELRRCVQERLAVGTN